jgi:hypothetical protein
MPSVWQGEYSANYSYFPTSSLISQIDYKWVNTNKLKNRSSVFLDGSAAFQEDKVASLMSTWPPG